MTEYFFNCQSTFEPVRSSLQEYLTDSTLEWEVAHGIEVNRIGRSFFTQFPKLDKLIDDFRCRRYPIFRFQPNTCYGWHIDHQKRSCALNMVIDGQKGHTYFGTLVSEKGNDSYEDVKEVLYEENKFTLLDVHKPHTVVNLNESRYLLSISIPPENGSFQDVKKYLTENSF